MTEQELDTIINNLVVALTKASENGSVQTVSINGKAVTYQTPQDIVNAIKQVQALKESMGFTKTKNMRLVL